MKKKDIIICFIIFIVIGIGYIIYSMNHTSDHYTYVYYHNKQIDKIDLNINDTYTYQGDNGSFTLEVKDHQYHAINVDCPNHNCEEVGWVSMGESTAIICLPNQIYVQQSSSIN